jgi:hypothetical protein
MDGGGIGAVSVGISEWLLWLLIPIVIVLLAAGVWKIVKFFWVIGG